MNNFSSRSLAVLLAVLLSGCSHLPTWMGGTEEEKPKLPGERMAVLPSQSVPVDPAIESMPVTVPEAALNAQWPQHMGTPRASIGNLKVTENFSVKDSQRAGEGEEWEQPIVVSPVMGGDMVFAMDGIGAISAHDAADVEKVRWQSRVLVTPDEDATLGGGLAYDDGKLYAASARGTLAALDAATGKELWRQPVGIPFRSPPKVDGGKLFAVSVDNQLFALDAASGAIVWTSRGIDETASYLGAVSPGIAGGLVIAPYSSGELQALRIEDGREVWTDTLIVPRRTVATALFSGIGADPVILGDVVLAVGSGGVMAAYQLPTGQRIWEQSLASVNTPWVAGDFAYVLTVDNSLVCLSLRDGRVRWAQQLPSYEDEKRRLDPYTWTGPIMADGRLLVTGAHGQMLVISPADGSVVETKEIPDGVYAPPIIATGRIYLVTRDAKLHALY